MRYFFDTEFIEDGRTIDLISIGVVAEDGRTYYAQSSEFDASKANDWVKANVLPHLNGEFKRRWTIAEDLYLFMGRDPEIWAYYAAYDWVALCQLFGTMMQLPTERGWPMYCRDIKQLCDDVGNPKLPDQIGTAHNALDDARWNMLAWQFLEQRVRDLADA